MVRPCRADVLPTRWEFSTKPINRGSLSPAGRDTSTPPCAVAGCQFVAASGTIEAVGKTYGAICNACGHRFEAREGSGFFFHVLHCDTCGAEKIIPFDQLGEAHLRYIKGPAGPHSKTTRSLDKFVQKNYPDPPLSEEEYHAIVEETAGDHACGGHFCFDAPVRCPKCGSADLRNDPDAPAVMYD